MGHKPVRLSANTSSVSDSTVGLSIPALAAFNQQGIAPRHCVLQKSYKSTVFPIQQKNIIIVIKIG